MGNATFSKFNTSKIPYCPIIVGVNLLDQITIMEELDEINFENVAFPILVIPFLSRARSEERRVGKECRSRW